MIMCACQEVLPRQFGFSATRALPSGTSCAPPFLLEGQGLQMVQSRYCLSLNPRPWTLDPKPHNYPRPYILDPEPYTLNPQPEAQSRYHYRLMLLFLGLKFSPFRVLGSLLLKSNSMPARGFAKIAVKLEVAFMCSGGWYSEGSR